MNADTLLDISLDPGRQPLSEAVYDAVSEAIRGGRWPRGTRLVEGELAARLQVSRTPVHDALRRLESDGLVTSEPNRGFIVADLMEDAEHVFLIRERLEGLAGYMAAHHIGVPELQHLDAVQSEMEHALAEPDSVEELVRLNTELHRSISNAARSPRLTQLLGRLHPQYVSYQVLRLYTKEEREQSITEHREILDALWKRDGERVDRLIQHHLEHGKTVVLKALSPD